MLQVIINKWTGGNVADDDALQRTYVEHYASIRSKVPRERLLEFESKDGWEPLCKFLGKPVPKDVPYPKLNDAKWTVKIHDFLYYLRVWQCTKRYIIAALILLLAAAISYWKLA